MAATFKYTLRILWAELSRSKWTLWNIWPTSFEQFLMNENMAHGNDQTFFTAQKNPRSEKWLIRIECFFYGGIKSTMKNSWQTTLDSNNNLKV